MLWRALNFLVLLVLICSCSQIRAPVAPPHVAVGPMEEQTGPLNKAEFDRLNDFVRGVLWTDESGE